MLSNTYTPEEKAIQLMENHYSSLEALYAAQDYSYRYDENTAGYEFWKQVIQIIRDERERCGESGRPWR